MTDLHTLETDLLTAIADAKDEAALETIRIAALGRNGSVSALLRTLGSMTPEERRQKGPLINGLKDGVNAAIAARKEELKRTTLDRGRAKPEQRSPANQGGTFPDRIEVGVSPLWRAGMRAVGLHLPWRLGPGEPFHTRLGSLRDGSGHPESNTDNP